MDSNGTVLHAYGYGPTGLVQRYYPNSNSSNAFYNVHSFDHLGNLAHCFNQLNSSDIPQDPVVYDRMRA